MQMLSYLKYFFYLARNWDLNIARHIIAKEIAGEKKYGIRTTGADLLDSLEEKGVDIDHSTIYMPASYDLLENVFAKFKIGNCSHLLDIGCGKGRALCVAAHFGVKKVSGIDFSKELCTTATANLQRTKQTIKDLRFTIYHNDAFYFEIENDVDCIFMFNPFDELIMSAVLENVETSLEERPRQLTIVYFNPVEKHLFFDYDYQEIYHESKLTYLDAMVLIKNPGRSRG